MAAPWLYFQRSLFHEPENAPDLTGRGRSVILEHETGFELAFPSRPSAAHTRCSLIAHSSPPTLAMLRVRPKVLSYSV